MTVAELAQLLADLPPDDMVVIGGYEGGLDEVSSIAPVRIGLNVHKESYYGKHAKASGYYGERAKAFANAVQIS